MNLREIIPLLTAQKPVEVFKKVVTFNEEIMTPSQRVVVRLGLASGFIIEGAPLTMDEDGNAVFMSTTNTISYVNTRSISGIEILTPMTLLSVLTDNKYVVLPENDIPTKLELKRNMKEIAVRLQTSYAIDLNSTDLVDALDTAVEKYQFKVLLYALNDALRAIGNDPLGNDALQVLKSIEVVQQEGEIVVEKKGEAISLRLDLNRKLEKDLNKQLQQKLEKYL